MTQSVSQFTRRDILKLSALAMAGTCVGRGRPVFAAESGKKIPIALQLYSVRTDCTKDFEGTVKAVAKMGYEGVEFAGYYNKQAADIRKVLDDCGLKCCGTHTGLGSLEGDNLKKTIEFNKTIGNKFLVVPGGLPGKRTWVECGKYFRVLAEKVKGEGMRVGYHNHSHEFKVEGGITHWEEFLDNAGPDVIMQMDMGNCMNGSGDPVAYLKKYPGRAVTVHMKEHFPAGVKGAIGEGDVKWREVIELCRTTAGTEWYIIEVESYPVSPLDSAEKCLAGLKKLLAC
ncbi:MAG: sugar phosphate isomerase/epimerase [Kiritimatiellae bacterium]|nr:sugar phosphate isomerase/epimerase [Kiritimatiellia bacterium]MDD5521847.1 sugar phosphate isomerase/epimerase [Kiritimatiellia bacterium]